MPDDLFGDADLSGVNPQLIAEARRVALATGVRSLGGLTAIAGHRTTTTSGNPSRHTSGNALDFSRFNGLSPLTPEGKSLAEQFASFATANYGYTRNRENGNPRAILFGFNDPARGGNHLNHVHMSYSPGLEASPSTSAGRAAAMPGKTRVNTPGDILSNLVGYQGIFGSPASPSDSGTSPVAPTTPAAPAVSSELISRIFDRPAPVDANKVPEAAGDAVDPIAAIKAGIGIKLRYTPEEQRTIAEWQRQLDGRDPNAAIAAQGETELKYITDKLQMRQKLGPPPTQSPYSLPGPIARTVPELPGRTPLPHNQGADIATAVMSALFPQMAGRFAAGNYGAATDEQGRQAQYTHQKYLADTHNADVAYGDQSQNREEGIHNDLLNRAIAQKNAEGQYGFDTGSNQLTADAARQKSLLDFLPTDTAARTREDEAGLREKQAERRVGENSKEYYARLAADNSEQKGFLTGMFADIRNRRTTETSAANNERTTTTNATNNERTNARKADAMRMNAMFKAEGIGKTASIDPVTGELVLTNQAPGDRNAKLKADLALKAAQTALASKRVSYLGSQMDKIAQEISLGGNGGLPKGVATMLSPFARMYTNTQTETNRARQRASDAGKTLAEIHKDPAVVIAERAEADAAAAFNKNVQPYLANMKAALDAQNAKKNAGSKSTAPGKSPPARRGPVTINGVTFTPIGK